MSVAWVFPGQGSQKIGMADEIISLPKALERFELASSMLGRDLLAICRGINNSNSDLDDLNDLASDCFNCVCDAAWLSSVMMCQLKKIEW